MRKSCLLHSYIGELCEGTGGVKMVSETNIERFFEGVKQGLGVLRPAIVELDLHLARQFDFFRFINLNENQMSDVFAYLLNPNETHGQRELFLGKFLEDATVDWLSGSRWSLTSIGREVPTTRIENWNRRIDIELVFQSDNGPEPSRSRTSLGRVISTYRSATTHIISSRCTRGASN